MMADALIDAGVGAAAVTAIIGAIILVARLPPVRWVLRHLISDPLATWFRVQVREEVVDVLQTNDRLAWIEDQLKSNGGRTLRDRVNALTDAAGIKAQPEDLTPIGETA